MKDQFGINIKEYCSLHEQVVRTAIAENHVTDELLAEHREKLSWLQHERLVHLIVTVMVVFVELFVVWCVLTFAYITAAIILLLLAVLLGFYFYHYFFLENTVQRWYKLTDEIKEHLPQKQ